MSTILVTGANGYIGSSVVKTLLNNSMDVIATDVKSNNIDNRAQIVECNILSQKTEPLPDWFGKADACLHLAWQDGFVHNALSHIENVSSHFVFLEKLVSLGISQIAVMGTMHEIGYWEGEINEETPTNPISLYGIAKDSLRRAVTAFLKDKNVIFQWLRAFYIYGNDNMNHSIFTKILQAAKNGEKTFPFNSGMNKYDFIHVDELARQIAACVSQRQITEIINCCSGTPISLKDKVEEFITEHGLDIKLQYGAFPDRPYDSSGVWGNAEKIEEIMSRL